MYCPTRNDVRDRLGCRQPLSNFHKHKHPYCNKFRHFLFHLIWAEYGEICKYLLPDKCPINGQFCTEPHWQIHNTYFLNFDKIFCTCSGGNVPNKYVLVELNYRRAYFRSCDFFQIPNLRYQAVGLLGTYSYLS